MNLNIHPQSISSSVMACCNGLHFRANMCTLMVSENRHKEQGMGRKNETVSHSSHRLS